LFRIAPACSGHKKAPRGSRIKLPRRIIDHRQVLTPLHLERRFGITGGNIFHGQYVARPDVRDASGGRLGAPGYNCARERLKGRG